jgi:hypothetical protein
MGTKELMGPKVNGWYSSRTCLAKEWIFRLLMVQCVKLMWLVLSCAIDGPEQLLMPPSLKGRVKVTWLGCLKVTSSFQQWDPGGKYLVFNNYGTRRLTWKNDVNVHSQIPKLGLAQTWGQVCISRGWQR